MAVTQFEKDKIAPESYIGLSTDQKPVNANTGSEFWESDTRATYVYTGSAWVLRGYRVNNYAENGGKPIWL